MKYRTASILFCNGRFKAFDSKSNLRGNVETTPNPLGSYEYPETMAYEEAFAKLKECMIESCEREIQQLTKNLNEIKALQI